MSNRRTRLLVTAAAIGVAASLTAASVTAPAMATRTLATHRVGPAGGQAQATAGGAHAMSRYLAGYRLTDPAHPYEVLVKAVDVPDVNCSDPHFEGVAIGAGSEPSLGNVEYFAGIDVTCVAGQPQYLMEAIVGDQEQGTGIEPGDQAQLTISLNCDAYPTCDVFSSSTSLDTDTSVSVQTTIDVTTDTAFFGAFPLFDGGSAKPAPVPDFGRMRVLGCLFDNHLISKGAERVSRVHHGTVQLKATKIHVGSFQLKYLHH